MLRMQDFVLDNSCIGSEKYLTDVTPVYRYANGQRTAEVEAYKYHIALPAKGLDKIAVKIPGEKPLLDAPRDGYIKVEFAGLEMRFFVINEKPQLVAKATGITKVKD